MDRGREEHAALLGQASLLRLEPTMNSSQAIKKAVRRSSVAAVRTALVHVSRLHL